MMRPIRMSGVTPRRRLGARNQATKGSGVEKTKCLFDSRPLFILNLTERGLARHWVTYVREMDEHELQEAGEGAPTIDRIEIAEFETQVALQEWLKKVAPVFFR